MKRFALLRRARGLRTMLGVALAGLVPTMGVWLSCMAGLAPVWLYHVLTSIEPSLRSGAADAVAIVLMFAAGLAGAIGVAMGTLRAFGWLQRARPRLGEVRVGADGLSIRRDLLHQRFVPWSAIESVRIDREGPLPAVVLQLVGGDAERLAVEDLGALENVLDEGLEVHRAQAPGPRIAALEPSADVKGWIANARDLARADGSYREGSRSPELLVRVAEDPTAPAVQRIGAALALSSAPEPIRARVRVATEETVDEEVADAMADALRGKVSRRAIVRLGRR